MNQTLMNKELIKKNIDLTEKTIKELKEKLVMTKEEGTKIMKAIEEGLIVNRFVLESFKMELSK